MPVLSNHRHERFAQNLAAGMGVGEAHAAAGYRGNPKNATDLRKKPEVAGRVAELLNQSAEKLTSALEVTYETIIDELEQARQLAHANGQAGAAVSAIVAKAKVSGLIIDRREVGDPGDFSELTDEEIVAKAAREARELGLAGPIPVDDGEAA